jgi:hypothetical protein
MTRDLRKYARQTRTRLLAGALLLLFLVGDGLIWAIYGREAAVMGLVCILAGLAPLLAIVLVLLLLEKVTRHIDRG